MQILITALVVAILDGVFAISFYWNILHASAPARVFRSIASGFLGKSAQTGGGEVIALGVATHYLVALGWTLGYVLVVRRIPAVARLVRTTGGRVAVGMVFGALGYCFMNFVVIPLSRATPQSAATWRFYAMTAWHMVGVGLPIVFLTERAPARIGLLREHVHVEA